MMRPKLVCVVADDAVSLYIRRGVVVTLLDTLSSADIATDKLQVAIERSRSHLAYVLTDVASEEYACVPFPTSARRVGRDLGKAIVRQQLSGANYAYWQVAGNPKSPHILCGGLRQSAVLDRLLDTLRASQIAVGGVYSLTGIIGRWLKPSTLSTCLLVISSQCRSEWRYSVYFRGRVVISRKVRHTDADQWAAIYTETRGTLAFLQQQAVPVVSGKPQVAVLASPLPLSAFGLSFHRKLSVSYPLLHGRFATPYEAIVGEFSPVRDRVFRLDSAQGQPVYRALRNAHVLAGVCGAVSAGAVSLSVLNTDTLLSQQSYLAGLRASVSRLSGDSDALRDEVSRYGASANEVDAAVSAFASIDSEGDVRELVDRVADVLTGMPSIRLERLAWYRTPADQPSQQWRKRFHQRQGFPSTERLDVLVRISLEADAHYAGRQQRQNRIIQALRDGGFDVSALSSEADKSMHSGALSVESSNAHQAQVLNLVLSQRFSTPS